LLAGTRQLHDNRPPVKDSAAMTGDELSELLREVGWPAAELARRLSIREDTVRGWLNGRREVPPNVGRWLEQIRDGIATAPALPDGWSR
jgi:DNA-binding transcriptional regulator YiaG